MSMLIFHLILLALHLPVALDALNIGLLSQSMAPLAAELPFPLQSSSVSSTMGCSNSCESVNCLVPPLLRYGKYCGLLHRGCPGEEPCDGLDDCCLHHDTCIASHGYDYLNIECNERLLDCIQEYRDSGAPSFEGNTCDTEEVVDIINMVIQSALLIKKVHG